MNAAHRLHRYIVVICAASSALLHVLFAAPAAHAQNRRDARDAGDLRLDRRAATAPAAQPAAQPAAEPAAAAPAAAPAAAEPTAPAPSALQRIVRFIRTNGVWIIAILVVALAGVGYWALRGGGDDTALKDEVAPPSSVRRFSSTRISANEVNDRVERPGVSASEVETDREYALVVDEDALRMPPLPDEVVDESTGRQYAESGDIRKLLEANRFSDAYERYVQRIERDTSLEFHSQLEQTLSEFFLRRREFDKVTRILEHHVSTHAASDVAAEIWFNLGYAHVLQKQSEKSRRCFERFCEKESDPKRVARARRLIEQLTRLGPLS